MYCTEDFVEKAIAYTDNYVVWLVDKDARIATHCDYRTYQNEEWDAIIPPTPGKLLEFLRVKKPLRIIPKVVSLKDWADEVWTPVDKDWIPFDDAWIREPLGWEEPKKIAVGLDPDIFDIMKAKQIVLDEIFAVMALSPRHSYRILTEYPENALDYVGNQKTGRGRPYTFIWRAIKGMGEDERIPFNYDFARWPLPNVAIGDALNREGTREFKPLPMTIQEQRQQRG